MDIARDKLFKKLEDISVEKPQSLLDLALRTTAAAADPCHEDLTCCLETSSLLRTLRILKDCEKSRNGLDGNDLQEPLSLTGLETFSLNYKVTWPLSIVISKKAVTKYQLIFCFLFHCKHVERQLCGAWQVHQVLEPNWHVMHNRLQTAKSIDEKVERLKSVCLQYASAIQRLIGSILSEKSTLSKSQSRCQALSITSSDTNFTDAILKFEQEFNAELRSLAPILSSSSQAEPYLTHLAQWILGTGNHQ